MATQTVYNRIGSKRDLLVALQEVIEEAGEAVRSNGGSLRATTRARSWRRWLDSGG